MPQFNKKHVTKFKELNEWICTCLLTDLQNQTPKANITNCIKKNACVQFFYLQLSNFILIWDVASPFCPNPKRYRFSTCFIYTSIQINNYFSDSLGTLKMFLLVIKVKKY